MRLRLSVILVLTGVVSLLCAVVVCVLVATFIDNSAQSETNLVFRGARGVMTSGTAAIVTDLRRMELYTEQTMARALPTFWNTVDPVVATTAYNQSFFDSWAPRLVVPGEVYGFALQILFPGSNITLDAYDYDVSAIQTYADPGRSGAFFFTHSWTRPGSRTNIFDEFTYTNVTGPILSGAPSDDNLILPYLVDLAESGRTGPTRFFETPYPYSAADGNPFWYYTHAGIAWSAHGTAMVAQTYQSSTLWENLMRPSLRDTVDENLYLLSDTQAIITSTDSTVQQQMAACADPSNEEPWTCAEIPIRRFPTLGAAGDQIGRWLDAGITSARAEVRVGGKDKAVVLAPAVSKDSLTLYMAYIGERPPPDRSTLAVFATMMALTLLAVIMTFSGVVLLLQPIRRAAVDMRNLAALDFTAFRENASSVVSEQQDVLESTNALVIAMESFTRYMSVGLVRHLMANGELAAVGTRAVQIAVLFTDIVGFTDACDRLSIQEVMTVFLGRFFEVCSDAVMRTGGTVDKFIGDCVMAFWGAPVAHPAAASAAIAAALHMQSALLHPEFAMQVENAVEVGAQPAYARYSKRARRHAGLRTLGELSDASTQGGTPSEYSTADTTPRAGFGSAQHVIRTRSGINFGEAHVGNVGCDQRLSYTALGDTVNVASRCEALNKQVSTGGCGVLVTDAVVERAHPALVRHFVGPTMLIGKSAPIDMFLVTGVDVDALSLPTAGSPLSPDGKHSKAFAGDEAHAETNEEAAGILRRLARQLPMIGLTAADTEAALRRNAMVAALARAHDTDACAAAFDEAAQLRDVGLNKSVLMSLRDAGVVSQASK